MMEDVTIDADYEFCAPKFFDFIEGETDDQIREAQLWFHTALTYAPSPIMHKIKTTRALPLCDFTHKESESTSSLDTMKNITLEEEKQSAKTQHENTEELKTDVASKDEHNISSALKLCVVEKTEELKTDVPSSNVTVDQTKTENTTYPSKGAQGTPMSLQTNTSMLQMESKKQQTDRRIASALKNQLQAKSTKTPPTMRRDTNQKNKDKLCGAPNFAQENQAIKRQKLEGGKTRQILNIKTQILPHKERAGVVSNSNLAIPSTRARIEERKMYVREHASVPFVSMAEMMRKFQSGTRDVNLPPRPSSLSHGDLGQVMQRKPKLTLTRPKEPAFETSQRVRSIKLKSSAELEEEMMAKIPKFKAHPVNRKILKAPTLPTMKRSAPQIPEFHEFHLETMERANQNAETSTVASTEAAAPRIHQWKPHLTTPKTPPLQTLLRARPPKIKSTEELEKEELDKVPKFKARPLNKMIFESKGELGLFCNRKRQVTTPKEFHFATDERIPSATTNVADLFDKLSVCSDSHNQKPIPRYTAPNPFHLHTEERGAEKVKRFGMEMIHKQIEEDQARIPKATPYPFTTDYPVVPPKPEPKQSTKPAPFRLESVARHEEEVQKEMEEKRRLKEEEAKMRMFKALPILKEDPVPIPEKVSRPLTEVREFDLHIQHRAVGRAEFDKKVKEKEVMYKRYRDEAESAKMMEEEKALKQLRRTLVPHARPVPNFDKPFLPRKSSKGVTRPKSPRLKITERRKMVVAAATSTAASNMR